MTCSDVPLCSWNSPVPLVGNTGLYFYRSVSTKQSGWLQNLWTDTETCVHCTNTCPRHQPLWPATWSNESLTHLQAYHKTSSTKQLVNGKSDYVQAIAWCKRTSLWISAKLKPALFRANTLHNRLFSEPPQSTEKNTLFHVISIAAI